MSFAQAFHTVFSGCCCAARQSGRVRVHRCARNPGRPCCSDVCRNPSISGATKGTITLAEAVDLIRTYLTYDAYRSFGPLIDGLDSRGRPARATLPMRTCRIERPATATLFRRAGSAANAPANPFRRCSNSRSTSRRKLRQGMRRARLRGRRGVCRAKRTAPRVDPIQHDGEDARAVIDWIAKQSWSDGRVGMYGGSYSGFTRNGPPQSACRAPSGDRHLDAHRPRNRRSDGRQHLSVNSAYRWSLLRYALPKRLDEISCYDDAPVALPGSRTGTRAAKPTGISDADVRP